MTFCRSLSLWANILGPYLVAWSGLSCLLQSSPAAADRIFDLGFWSTEQSALSLGGLWEFHAQTLLEPSERGHGSELLVDIGQPWREFIPLSNPTSGKLEQASYVILLKGFPPSPAGYAISIREPLPMTRVIAAPKYAPEQSQRVETDAFFGIRQALRTFFGARLQLIFSPQNAEEIWLIIVQRWRNAADASFGVPQLSRVPEPG